MKKSPIHKSSDRNYIKMYSPISLLTSFFKLLEKVMYDKIMCFIETNNILWWHHYGFRAKHGTVYIAWFIVLMLQVKTILNILWQSSVTCPSPLMHSITKYFFLSIYGIRGIRNDWFSSYLSNRIQFVEINGNTSFRQHILCGVPQGKILDLCYICRLQMTLPSLFLIPILPLFEDANTEINYLYNWFARE